MVRSLFYIACYFVSLHSQASVTEKYPEASYEMMSGACVVTISRMKLSLIRGYVINPKGYVLGRLERLSDFHFIFHKQVETEINNQTIYSSLPVAMDSVPLSSSRMSFSYAVSGKALFDCDFSKLAYE